MTTWLQKLQTTKIFKPQTVKRNETEKQLQMLGRFEQMWLKSVSMIYSVLLDRR